MKKNVEIEAAEALLDVGVSLPFLQFKMPFRKKPVSIRVTIHGKRDSKMVSLTICRGAVSGLLFSGIVAWLLRWFVPDKYLQGANQRFVTLLGTKSFMRIIESVQISNPLKPRESQKRKGS